MDYDWQRVSECARKQGFDQARPGDVAMIAGLLSSLDVYPFGKGVLDEVRDYLLQSLHFRQVGLAGGTCVYLTFFGNDSGSEFMKVGISGSLKNRMCAIQSSNPIALLWTWAAEMPSRRDAYRVEQAILAALAGVRVAGEWVQSKCANDEVAAKVVASIEEIASAVPGGVPARFARVGG